MKKADSVMLEKCLEIEPPEAYRGELLSKPFNRFQLLSDTQPFPSDLSLDWREYLSLIGVAALWAVGRSSCPKSKFEDSRAEKVCHMAINEIGAVMTGPLSPGLSAPCLKGWLNEVNVPEHNITACEKDPMSDRVWATRS